MDRPVCGAGHPRNPVRERRHPMSMRTDLNYYMYEPLARELLKAGHLNNQMAAKAQHNIDLYITRFQEFLRMPIVPVDKTDENPDLDEWAKLTDARLLVAEMLDEVVEAEVIPDD